jgi:16S rRNA processing protein RimM
MGRILAPYGVRGWVKVQPLTEAPDGLLGYGTWWLGQDGDWHAHRMAEGHVHGAHLVVRLGDIADREKAAALRGQRIAVPRSHLPAAAEGEYYWTDLLGLTVVNLQGEDLGRVAEIFATGANDVLVVQGERERLIPFVGHVVVEVELEKSRVLVDWGAHY